MKRILSAAMAICLIFLTFSVFAEGNEENSERTYPGREYEFSGKYEKKKTAPEYELDRKTFASLTEKHPYLYIRQDDIQPLREATQGKYKERFKSLLEYVDEAVEQGPTEWYISENTEENWIRDVSDNLCNISFAYLMTQDEKYLDSAIVYIEALCGYKHWGRPGTPYENNDLAASHALRALALSYDWLYYDLPSSTKAILLKTAKQRGEKINAGGWWNASYMQNHLWYTRYAAALIGASIINEYPEARVWIEKSIADFNKAASFMGDDGGAHEGMQYWRYGNEAYLLFHLFAKETLGIDYTNEGYDKNSWLAPMYFWIGEKDWKNAEYILDFADSSRVMDVSTVAALLSFYAKLYQNGNAKWLSDKMYEYSAENNIRIEDWWSFILNADDVEAVPPSENLPTGYLFEDLGYVLSRSDWGGNESVLGFRCGMNTGAESLGYDGNAGSSHVHPDIGAPVLYGCGEYLLRDDGYGTTSRTNHSELFINGSGQPWDKTKQYLLSVYPYIETYKDTDDYTYAACNGTDAYGGLEAYKQEFELEKWVRHFLYLKKKNCLLVVDEVKTKADKDLEFRWFPESTDLAMQGSKSSIAVGKRTQLKITSLDDSSDVYMENKSVPYKSGTRTAVSINKKGSEWTTATAITWSEKEKSPRNVSGSRSGDDWSFDLGSATVKLNTKTHKIELVDYGENIQIFIDSRQFKSDSQIMTDDGTFYMPMKDLLSALGYKVGYIKETDSVSVQKGAFMREIPLSDTKESGKLFNADGKAMITTKQMSEFFSIVAYYDNSNNIIKVKTKDFNSDASLSNVIPENAETVKTEIDGNKVSLTVLGDASGLTVIPVSLSAEYELTKISDRSYTAKIIAEDKKTVNNYEIEIKHPTGLGEIGVKSVEAIGNDGNLPINTLDGLESTYWAYDVLGSWIMYELDGEWELNGFKTAWHKYNARAAYYEAYVSSDGENWTKLGDYTAEKDIQFDEHTIEPVSCRYVKLICNGNSANSWCSLRDIGFFGKSKGE